MCLSVPGRIVSLLRDEATTTTDSPGVRAIVDVSGVRRVIDIGLLAHDDVGCGDWVLIHMGYALSKVDAGEAAAVLALIESNAPVAETS